MAYKDRVYSCIRWHSLSTYDILRVHPWIMSIDSISELSTYMQGIGISEDSISNYMFCTGLANFGGWHISDLQTPENSLVLHLYKSIRLFTNIQVRKIYYEMTMCMKSMCCSGQCGNGRVTLELLPEFRHVWRTIHKCGERPKWNCGCKWTIEEITKRVEDHLMKLHNDTIGGFGLLWEDSYENTDCMTTWIPREMMEDVVDMCGGSHPNTRLVRT